MLHCLVSLHAALIKQIKHQFINLNNLHTQWLGYFLSDFSTDHSSLLRIYKLPTKPIAHLTYYDANRIISAVKGTQVVVKEANW